MSEFSAATIEQYHADGSWDAETIADLVARNAVAAPEAVAFHAPEGTLTWREYDEAATRLAGAYVLAGLPPERPLAVLLTGGALTHVAYLAAQRAGLVTLGLGPRAGDAEISHLLRHTEAVALVSRAVHRGRPGPEIAHATGAPAHLELDLVGGQPVLRRDGVDLPMPSVPAAVDLLEGRGLGPDDLFFLNSTSGTTGRPKCVRQTMNVRKYFAALAADAGAFGPDEVVLSALPAPYGFGLWSAHVVPARYRFPTVLAAEFDPAGTLELIERHRVTVLAAVTSQFIMLLNHESFARRDLSSLRVLFTGGERVPAHRAMEFEERTGCAVLQFYGSNEAGPISVTRVADPRPARLGTAGRPVPAMRVRLLGPDGEDVPDGPGQVAVNGPGCAPGYFRDEPANRLLFRPDGWLRTGDLGRLDEDGYLSITGRTADFIIRGGHNVSAPVVEEAVGGHPRVAQVAALGMPDEVLGERVCAFVVTRDGGELTLDELRVHLDATGVSKVNWPERLVGLPALPLGVGGKVDKAALRALL
ncbi:acyl--CoA ligase [Micromonospora sp. AMSO12t]|uniref:class I adenylate-forming enzyme family protein n=1 Tax=Micromonospora sp. AMSO12t TaxID=2650410 RepID=UPI00124B47FD|nr:class I adenylate-forming enzyme family protein [Micromonospora sp. AMSO12t]KAB1162338.1 acyl--CoA ligase [Micromonospora sp. AMSO12t]